ncbi:unnamed protein product [Closterium sp. NIES-54]
MGVRKPGGVEPWVAKSEGAESGGAEPQGTASSGGPASASPRQSPRLKPLSPQQLREWFSQRTRIRSGAAGAGVSAAGDTGAGGVGVTAGAGGTGGAAASSPGGARTRGTGAAGTSGVGGAGAGGAGAGDPAEPGGAGAGGYGAGGAGARGAGAGDTGAVGAGAGGSGAGGAGTGGAGAGDIGTVDLGAGGTGAGGIVRLRPYFVPLLQQPASPLPAPSSYTEQIGGPTQRREPESHPALPVRAVRTSRRVPRPRPPPVPGTQAMALRPSSVPLRSHSLLSSFESTAASALVAELVEFAAACRLDYATALVAESKSVSPPFVGGECALGTDVLEDRQEDLECLAAAVPRFASMLLAPEGDPDAPDIPTPRSYVEAITGPYSSQWQASKDAEMASWKSTGTYINAVPLSRANIVLQHFGFQFSSQHPTPLSTGHSLSAPPSDESVEPSGSYSELMVCLITSGMGLVLGGRGPVVLTGHADASWVDDLATQWSSQGYTFSLGSGFVSLRSTRSSSVLSSSCEVEIYAGAMAAEELRWLTYLLTDLGEQPRSPPILYVDNKVMIALCQEYRMEHRTKHIALRYFLAQELQQRGQLHLAYVATRANTADIFTKALPPGDHQCFSSVLGLVPTLPHLLTA